MRSIFVIMMLLSLSCTRKNASLEAEVKLYQEKIQKLEQEYKTLDEQIKAVFDEGKKRELIVDKNLLESRLERLKVKLSKLSPEAKPKPAGSH